MADYTYVSATQDAVYSKRLRKQLYLGLVALLMFLGVALLWSPGKAWLAQDPRRFPCLLILNYLMVLSPSRAFSRASRFQGIEVRVDRRGVTRRVGKQETRLLWRDVVEAEIDSETTTDARVCWKRIRLVAGKLSLILEQDPPHVSLDPQNDLYATLRRNVASVRQWQLGYGSECPSCGGRLLAGATSENPAAWGQTCSACALQVRLQSPWGRPWKVFRVEIVYLILLLLIAGGSFAVLSLVLALGTALVHRSRCSAPNPSPLLASAPKAEATKEEQGSLPPAGQGSKLSSGAALALALLLGNTPGWCQDAGGAAPGSHRPTTPPASPAGPARVKPKALAPATRQDVSRPPNAQVRVEGPDASYLPLRVGNTWEYACNGSRLVARVTAEEQVNGVRCWLMESFLGSTTESCQKESYASTPQGLTVLKRTHRGADLFLTPAETVLAFPVQASKSWTWKGPVDQGLPLFTFVEEARVSMVVMGRTVTALPVLLTGRANDGSEVQTRRWYVKDIGMVREKTVLRKAAKVFRFEAVLQNYALRVDEAASPDRTSLPAVHP